MADGQLVMNHGHTQGYPALTQPAWDQAVCLLSFLPTPHAPLRHCPLDSLSAPSSSFLLPILLAHGSSSGFSNFRFVRLPHACFSAPASSWFFFLIPSALSSFFLFSTYAFLYKL